MLHVNLKCFCEHPRPSQWVLVAGPKRSRPEPGLSKGGAARTMMESGRARRHHHRYRGRRHQSGGRYRE